MDARDGARTHGRMAPGLARAAGHAPPISSGRSPTMQRRSSHDVSRLRSSRPPLAGVRARRSARRIGDARGYFARLFCARRAGARLVDATDRADQPHAHRARAAPCAACTSSGRRTRRRSSSAACAAASSTWPSTCAQARPPSCMARGELLGRRTHRSLSSRKASRTASRRSSRRLRTAVPAHRALRRRRGRRRCIRRIRARRSPGRCRSTDLSAARSQRIPLLDRSISTGSTHELPALRRAAGARRSSTWASRRLQCLSDRGRRCSAPETYVPAASCTSATAAGWCRPRTTRSADELFSARLRLLLVDLAAAGWRMPRATRRR